MKIPKQARREAKHLFRACIVGSVLDESRVRETVKKVIEVKPRGYLAILTQFQRLVKLDLERRKAVVESAVPLGQDLQDLVRANLAKAHGPALNVSFLQNESLIGGLRIKVGSDVYDGSIQARLKALEESF
ncbi:MAG: F0F1 ATP synthase subunit delta [Verrucomicrobiota bacterium]|jgi:F-type H+-transporting ATPase subunit delta|nr:F0F1 ATP synthase subunit delta [Verrucomicrobiota bacterium]